VSTSRLLVDCQLSVQLRVSRPAEGGLWRRWRGDKENKKGSRRTRPVRYPRALGRASRNLCLNLFGPKWTSLAGRPMGSVGEPASCRWRRSISLLHLEFQFRSNTDQLERASEQRDKRADFGSRRIPRAGAAPKQSRPARPINNIYRVRAAAGSPWGRPAPIIATVLAGRPAVSAAWAFRGAHLAQ
jgi:hypothetical protein